MISRLASWIIILCVAAGLALGAASVVPIYQGLVINSSGTLTVNGTSTTAIRTVLQSNTTYYVNANSGGTAVCGVSGSLTCQQGSDSNDGSSNATPFLTLQHAYNVITQTVDAAGFTITINLAHGSSANYDLLCNLGRVPGSNGILVTGDSTAGTAATIVDPNNGYGLNLQSSCRLSYTFVAFADSAGTNALGHVVAAGGTLLYNQLTFGGLTSGVDMSATAGGNIIAQGAATVTAGAPSLLSVTGPGSINFGTFHFGISTAMSFVSGTAVMIDGGEILALTTTFNGAGVNSVTGPKVIVSGVASTGGVDPNTIFPGSVSTVAANLISGNQLAYGNGISGGSTVFASLPTCATNTAGGTAYITDSTTVTWGATITGSGSNKVMAFCDGSNWTVFGK